MRLEKHYLAGGAVHHSTDLGHRQTAVEHAIEGIGKLHEVHLAQNGQDPLGVVFGEAMRDYAVECLLQGAYVREYHLWEKNCKDYFQAMANRNGATLEMRTKDTQPFTSAVARAVAIFGVQMPDDVLGAIETMRKRSNTMKHESGLEPDHFITSSDYATAVEAIENFWSHILASETVKA